MGLVAPAVALVSGFGIPTRAAVADRKPASAAVRFFLVRLAVCLVARVAIEAASSPDLHDEGLFGALV